MYKIFIDEKNYVVSLSFRFHKRIRNISETNKKVIKPAYISKTVFD